MRAETYTYESTKIIEIWGGGEGGDGWWYLVRCDNRNRNPEQNSMKLIITDGYKNVTRYPDHLLESCVRQLINKTTRVHRPIIGYDSDNNWGGGINERQLRRELGGSDVRRIRNRSFSAAVQHIATQIHAALG